MQTHRYHHEAGSWKQTQTEAGLQDDGAVRGLWTPQVSHLCSQICLGSVLPWASWGHDLRHRVLLCWGTNCPLPLVAVENPREKDSHWWDQVMACHGARVAGCWGEQPPRSTWWDPGKQNSQKKGSGVLERQGDEFPACYVCGSLATTRMTMI